MSTYGTNVNMLDLANLTAPDGTILSMIKSMAEKQDILKDIYFAEANDKRSHMYVRNAALASGTWVELNNGISASKGAEVPARADLAMLESRLTIDERFKAIERDYASFAMRKAYAHYEGLAQDMADAIVLGTRSGGYGFTGIEGHIDSASQTDQFGQSMFHSYAGTGTAMTSILAIEWGPDKVYMAYPQGHAYYGVEAQENGRQLIDGNNSSSMWADVWDFKWYGGLVIADDRCVRRIGNLKAAGSSNNLRDSTYDVYPLIDGLVSMQSMGNSAKLYMNRAVWGQLWKVSNDMTTVFRDADNPWGAPDYKFGNNTIRFTESLLNTESAVS